MPGSRVDWAMRVLLLLFASGCTSMTIRSGLVVIGGRPAFQASIEVGPAVVGKRHGVGVGTEWGIESDGRGTRALSAVNLDVIQNDADEGPVARLGARFRGTITDDRRRQSAALLLRSAAYVGVGRDPERRSGGLGLELAGGATIDLHAMPIVEANLVFGAKATKGTVMD